MSRKVSTLRTHIIKILVAVGLLFLSGSLLLIYFRYFLGSETSTFMSEFVGPLVLGGIAICIGVFVAIFLPRDIKTFSVTKKWLIGIIFSLIFFVGTFAFCFLIAIIFM